MRPGKNSTNSLSNLSLFGAQETRFASLARKAALAALHWSKGGFQTGTTLADLCLRA
jgi:hypothetical protein